MTATEQAIHKLVQEHPGLTTGEIAERLGFSIGEVAGAVVKLAEAGKVQVHK